MTIREFIESDRKEVDALLLRCNVDASPKHIGTYSCVIEQDKKIIGFAWAFADDMTKTACIDYFAVDAGKRNGFYALYLMQSVLSRLFVGGYEKVVGVLPDQGDFTPSLLKMYASLGMSIKHSSVVSGNINSILKALPERKAA